MNAIFINRVQEYFFVRLCLERWKTSYDTGDQNQQKMKMLQKQMKIDLALWIKVRRVDFLRRLVGKFKNLLTGAMGNVVHVPPTW